METKNKFATSVSLKTKIAWIYEVYLFLDWYIFQICQTNENLLNNK